MAHPPLRISGHTSAQYFVQATTRSSMPTAARITLALGWRQTTRRGVLSSSTRQWYRQRPRGDSRPRLSSRAKLDRDVWDGGCTVQSSPGLTNLIEDPEYRPCTSTCLLF